jgi:hypothetical protein
MNRPDLRIAETSPWNRAEAYADQRPDLYDGIDPIDLRVRALQLSVHPRIGWFQLSLMCLVAVFLGVAVAVQL